jgi:hypothetical protein
MNVKSHKKKLVPVKLQLITGCTPTWWLWTVKNG